MQGIQINDKVRHPTMPDWGLGKVIEISPDRKARVFFLHVGEKLLGLKYVDLEKVEGAEAENFILDSPTLNERLVDKDFRSLPDALREFQKLFPDGFEDQLYWEEERTYKLEAHNLFNEILSPENYSSLLDASEYDEVVKRALHVVNKTNLIFPNEKMALKDGLKDEKKKRQFSEKLYELLYGAGELRPRFEAFARHLEDIGAAKWTIVSYFLFIAFPDRYIFLKPTVCQHAAKLVKAELNYRPNLNWLTYKCLLEFAENLKTYLVDAGMAPRDMIDIQSFMWCIAPGKQELLDR